MEWSIDDLQEVSRMAAAAFTPRQVAHAFGLDWTQFLVSLQDENHAVHEAYFTGLNSSELAVRESAFELARNGSGPAQTFALKLFDEVRKSIRKDGITSEAV